MSSRIYSESEVTSNASCTISNHVERYRMHGIGIRSKTFNQSVRLDILFEDDGGDENL